MSFYSHGNYRPEMLMNQARLSVIVGCVVALGLVSTATAQDAEAPPADEAAPAIEALSSTQRDALSAALQTLGRLAHEPAVTPVSDRIRRGLPPDLIVLAAQTLAQIGRPEAAPVLFELARYRRVDVRVVALEAIVSTRSPDASDVLVRALGDPAPRVRATAAVGLGNIADPSAVPALIAALAAGVVSAGPVVGQLIDDGSVPALLEQVAQTDNELVLPAFSVILSRGDLASDARITILVHMELHPGPEVIDFLRTWIAANGEHSEVVSAAEALLLRIAE